MIQADPAETDTKGARLGVFFIVMATVIWGLSPLYYAQLNAVPAGEVVAHRILWSFPVIALYGLATGRWARFVEAGRSARMIGAMGLATSMISVNWVVFVVAIQIGQTAQASFGYYIYPIIVVVLGRVVFGERITPLQWAAASIAACGVFWLGLHFDGMPWIAIVVGLTFAAYGVIRKRTEIGPLVGVMWELTLVMPILALYLLWVGGGVFGQDMRVSMLLIGSSLFTAIPLVMFVEAAKRLRFSTVGVLFYINPTLQLASALILGEALSAQKITAFCVIWLAVALYCFELLRGERG